MLCKSKQGVGKSPARIRPTPNKMKKALAPTDRPRRDEGCPVATGHDRLAVIYAGPAGNGNPDSIDLEPIEPLDGGLDDLIISPAD